MPIATCIGTVWGYPLHATVSTILIFFSFSTKANSFAFGIAGKVLLLSLLCKNLENSENNVDGLPGQCRLALAKYVCLFY